MFGVMKKTEKPLNNSNIDMNILWTMFNIGKHCLKCIDLYWIRCSGFNDRTSYWKIVLEILVAGNSGKKCRNCCIAGGIVLTKCLIVVKIGKWYSTTTFCRRIEVLWKCAISRLRLVWLKHFRWISLLFYDIYFGKVNEDKYNNFENRVNHVLNA